MVASRAHVYLISRKGYGLYCRMSENCTPEPPQEEAADSSNSNVLVVDQQQQQQHPNTRSQRQATNAMANAQAAANSHGAQSITATTGYHSLATAMPKVNASIASNVDKGIQPKWDSKSEAFVDFQHKEKVGADSHDIRRVLEHEAYGTDLPKHNAAMRIILLT